jgi:hypothetical protein
MLVMAPDDQDMSPWIEGEPAFLLEEGVGYVRAWARAQHAVSELQQALSDLGHSDAMAYLRADVNVFGNGVVELGRVTPETAALLAQAVRALTAKSGEADGGQAA